MSVRLIRTIRELHRELESLRRSSRSLGLVPTMGALHAGHGALIDGARRECDAVVVSVFVNPLQFGPQEDYEKYPRDLECDLQFCRCRGADWVFVPSKQEVYGDRQRTFVEVTPIGDHLCGRFRPGHFRGVATAVLKLLNIVQPNRAYFGEKDFQQLVVISRMVADLSLPVQIVGVPTVREADGLAVSSRNQFLDPDQRKSAASLYRALQAAQQCIARGATQKPRVRQTAIEILQQEVHVRVEYLEIVDPDNLQPVERISGPVRIAAAVWIGSTRLIDNLYCGTPQG